MQKQVLNDSKEWTWRRSIEVLDEAADRSRTLSLFPEYRCEGCCRTPRLLEHKQALFDHLTGRWRDLFNEAVAKAAPAKAAAAKAARAHFGPSLEVVLLQLATFSCILRSLALNLIRIAQRKTNQFGAERADFKGGV